MSNPTYQTFIGYGSDFQRSTDGSTYASVGNCPEIGPPERKAADKDVSYLQMATRDRFFQQGLHDGGEASFKLLMDKTKQNVLEGDFNAGTTLYWKVVFPDGASQNSTMTFQGYVNGLGEPIQMDEEIMLDVKIKVSGKVTFNPGS